MGARLLYYHSNQYRCCYQRHAISVEQLALSAGHPLGVQYLLIVWVYYNMCTCGVGVCLLPRRNTHELQTTEAVIIAKVSILLYSRRSLPQ